MASCVRETVEVAIYYCLTKWCRNIVVPKSPEFYFGTRQFGTCTKISDILIDAETSYIQVPKHLEIGTESKHLGAETS